MSQNPWYNSPGTRGYKDDNSKRAKAFDDARHRLAVGFLFWLSIALFSFGFWIFAGDQKFEPSMLMWVALICCVVFRVGTILVSAIEGSTK
ncbi:hypothetical protein FB480_101890 [Agrobacterium vitis]|nr:hypothetical protein FB480_101890 [Agrobacterium vitis]